MTKEKFQQLCRQVLVPLVADMLHKQMLELIATQDAMAAELLRLSDSVERIVIQSSPTNEDHR